MKNKKMSYSAIQNYTAARQDRRKDVKDGTNVSKVN
jgi:hypothetical protein